MEYLASREDVRAESGTMGDDFRRLKRDPVRCI